MQSTHKEVFFMRKKWIVLIIAILITCSISACTSEDSGQNGSRNKDQSGTEEKREQSDSEDPAGKQQDGGLSFLICHAGLFSRFCSTEDGFYYLTEKDTELSDGSYAPRLMYMDYDTCREVCLCSDSSCRHDTKECTSVLAGASQDGRIFFWDGYLYFLNRIPDTSGSTVVNIAGDSDISSTEAARAELYRMKPDGSGRECVCRFEADAVVEDVALGSPDGLYFVTKKLGASESSSGVYTTTSDRKLICVDPGSGKARTACSLDFDDGLNWSVIGCADGQAVLKAYQYADGVTEEDAAALDENGYMDLLENSRILYAALNLDDGEKTQVYSQSAGGNSASEAIVDDCLYASNDSSGDVVKIDLTTGEKSRLCSLENNYLYGALGNYLCCTSHDLTADYGYYLVDTKNGEVTYCSLTNESLGWRLDLMAVAGNRALVVYDYEYTDLGDDSYEITRYQYGLISMNDLLDSVPDYTPVQMAGEGI